MKNIIATIILAAIAMIAACGGGASNTTSTNAPANKSANTPANAAANATANANSTASAPAGGDSEAATKVIKDIYDHAMKGHCDAIPPLLTENFRKELTQSKDELKAMCDVLTDSGKVTTIDVEKAVVTGDKATVKVNLTKKDGTKDVEDIDLVKENGQWRADS